MAAIYANGLNTVVYTRGIKQCQVHSTIYNTMNNNVRLFHGSDHFSRVGSVQPG